MDKIPNNNRKFILVIIAFIMLAIQMYQGKDVSSSIVGIISSLAGM